MAELADTRAEEQQRQYVEEVVQGFLDASYARDWEKMQVLFHDGFQFFGHDQHGALRKQTKEEFVGGYRARAADKSWAYYPSYNEILSVDFTSERTAVARTKLRIQDRIYTDILSLISLNGAWGIIAKVAASEPIQD